MFWTWIANRIPVDLEVIKFLVNQGILIWNLLIGSGTVRNLKAT